MPELTTLAVRHIFDSHIAKNIIIIFSDIIREWGIPKEVIGKVLTDNGSNMLKALQLFLS